MSRRVFIISNTSRPWPFAVTIGLIVAEACVAHAQHREQRMIAAPAAMCRSRPDLNADVTRSYRVGNVIDVDADTVTRGGSWHSTETRYESGMHPACWVDDQETVGWTASRPEAALDTVVMRALRDSLWRFEDLVAVENLLGAYASGPKSSGLLQYRRLLLIEKAGNAAYAVRDNPLVVFWINAHAKFLSRDEFGGWLYVRAKPFWDLYEIHKSARWADELAWKAAQLFKPTDECMSDCILRAYIVDGPMQYWKRLPNGRAIVSALELAAEYAKLVASEACYDRKETPPSRSDSPVPAPLLAQIRESLARVTAPEKQPLLAYLREAAAKCR